MNNVSWGVYWGVTGNVFFDYFKITSQLWLNSTQHPESKENHNDLIQSKIDFTFIWLSQCVNVLVLLNTIAQYKLL